MAAKLAFAAAYLVLASGTASVVPEAGAKFLGLLSKSMTDSKGLGPEELTGMEDAIETLVTKGDDESTRAAVAQMSDFIVKTLLPNRERARQTDQKLLDSSFKELQECSLDRARMNDMHLDEKMSRANSHRSNYHKYLGKHGECMSVLDGKKLLRDARCHGVDNLKETCHEAVPAKTKECCDDHHAYEAQSDKCENSKTEADYSQKQVKIVMTDVCNQYSKCYDNNSKKFNEVEKRVKASDARREWHTLYRIKCLVDEFKTGKVSQTAAKDCKEKDYGINQMKYPETPTKETCSTAVLQLN